MVLAIYNAQLVKKIWFCLSNFGEIHDKIT